jgi:lysozyme
MLLGLDVSNHQKTLNWRDLKSAYGLAFAFCKATEGGNYRDPYFAHNWQGIAGAGLVRGAYHYARPGVTTAVQQADLFLAMLIDDLRPEDKLILDLESTALSATETNAWAKRWATRVTDRTGRQPGIYTGSYLKNSTGSGFNKYFSWWWYPNYPNKYRPTTSRPGYIIIPPPPNVWERQPDIWQYTDKFDNRLDASVYDGTVNELRNLGAGEDDMQISDDDIDRIADKVISRLWLGDWPEGDGRITAQDRLAQAAHTTRDLATRFAAIDTVLAEILAKIAAHNARIG